MGPDFFHASFSVRVIPIFKMEENIDGLDWIEFAGIARITESASKVSNFKYIPINNI